MNRYIALIAIILSIGVVGGRSMARTSVVIEDDVLIGNTLPYWGMICTDANVYGDPYQLTEPLYIIKSGEVVTLRELYKTWVMIAPAQWIQLSTVCPWNE